MRKFIVSLYCGEGNTTKIVKEYLQATPYAAMNLFCFENEAIGFPIRQEQPEMLDGLLYSVWSAGCTISGQRLYIREHIGY